MLQEYNGFNLCVADLVSGEFGYLTNRGKDAVAKGPLKLEHQLYGLSNGVLQDMWPKVTGLCGTIHQSLLHTYDQRSSCKEASQDACMHDFGPLLNIMLVL